MTAYLTVLGIGVRDDLSFDVRTRPKTAVTRVMALLRKHSTSSMQMTLLSWSQKLRHSTSYRQMTHVLSEFANRLNQSLQPAVADIVFVRTIFALETESLL